MPKLSSKTKLDGMCFLTPKELALRWSFHPESIRRKIRRGEIDSVVIGRRRLIPAEEVLRIEKGGRFDE